MKQDPSALVAKLDGCGLGESLSRRLARENGWPEAYARRVLREYTRFLALAMSSEHEVSPSEQIDQAWHLHLLDSARYRRFCRDVLGGRLDHRPSDGSCQDRARHVRAYEQTLDSYRRSFGEPAPWDIWPSSERRFGADLCVQRVNVAENWVVPKPRRWLEARYSAPQVWPALVGGALVLVGCGGDIGLSPSVSGPEFLRGFFWFWLATLVSAAVVRSLQKGSPPGQLADLDPYQLAHLAGGADVALDSAVTALLARGALFFDPVASSLRVEAPLPADARRLEREIYDAIGVAGKLDIDDLRSRSARLTSSLEEELLALGLLSHGRSWLPLSLALMAPLWGAVRLLSRVGSDKPIVFLLLWSVGATALAYALFRPRPTRTGAGEAALRDARRRHAALRSGDGASELVATGTLPIAFGLFGLAAVPLPEVSELMTALKRRGNYDGRSGADTASSCSSGCSDGGASCGGDGGCGGGCGGCGGS